MKRILAVLLSCMMLFVMTAACNGNNEPEVAEEPEIEIEIQEESEVVEEPTPEPEIKEDVEQEVEDEPEDEVEISSYSVNTEVFMYLGKTPEEVTDLAGEHTESIWFSGWWHMFGDFWFVFDDVEHPTGQSIFLFCDLSDIIDGITADIEVSELDNLFGHQATFSTVENSELFTVGYLQYEHQGIEISIDAEPNTRIGKDAFVRLRII